MSSRSEMKKPTLPLVGAFDVLGGDGGRGELHHTEIIIKSLGERRTLAVRFH